MLKPVQQANGKRRLSSTQQACGRLLRLHGPRYLFALFSAVWFACTALVIFSLSFLVSWGPLGSLFAALEPLLAALGHSWAALGRPWAALGRSWAALGPLLATHGPLLAALGRLLGCSWPLLGRHAKMILEDSMPTITDFAPQRVPKGSQRGARIEPKRDPKRRKKQDEVRHEKHVFGVGS